MSLALGSDVDRNSECYVCVRMVLSWPSERVARSRSALPRGSRTALGRAKGLEEDGAGPSGGGGERGIFKHRALGLQGLGIWR